MEGTSQMPEGDVMLGYSRLSVLARLTIGFVALFVVTISVGLYSLVKLNQFNGATTYMLDVGERMVEYKEKLSAALLSQVSYEKKYFISKDYALYNRYVSAGEDFAKYLNGAATIADTLGSREILDGIGLEHARYRRLVDEETKRVASPRDYPPDWYRAEKEKAVEAMIKELRNLEIYVHDDTKGRIERLATAGTRALRVALGMAAFSFLLGIFIAFAITRSITRPLAAMKRKTQEIAEGNFETPLNFSSPPEIGELDRAFDAMGRKLGEMDRMKSEFFSLMAHELRTPLTAIKAGINLLQKSADRLDGERKEKVLAIVTEESNRLIKLVNSLLDLSKMEAGLFDFEYVSGTVNPLLEKAATEMEPLSVARTISLQLDLAEDCPAVMMDGERILQVIRNLLGNALKFTPEGGHVKLSLKSSPGGLEFAVADSGPGIPEEERAVIFEKYQQGQTGGAARARGTGLGLAMAKHIVRAHGGKIWVESEVVKGSIFTVFLPV